MSYDEEADDLFLRFVRGDDLSHYERLHMMRPVEHDHGIWEIKTLGLRFFGWFGAHDAFVISDVDTKLNISDNSLYSFYKARALAFRAALDLDEPKYVSGSYANVISS